MNLSCGSRTIKYLIFSFNFFFVITGIILIAVGASIRTYFVKYDYFLNNHYFSLPNLLIATGTLIFIICFLGCYGAMKNSWIMLLMFSVLLGIIFIFEFSAGIAGYVLRDKTTSYLETSMTDSLQQYFDKKNPATGLWDVVQPKFECCGVTDMYDWTKISGNNSLPISCCPQLAGQWDTFSCNANPRQPQTTSSTTTSTTVKTAAFDANNNNQTGQGQGKVANVSHLRKKRVDTPPTSPTPEPTGGSSTDSNSPASTNATESSSTTTTVTTTSTTTASTTPITTASTTTTVPITASEKSTSPTTVTVPTTPAVPSTTVPYQVGCATAFGSWVKAHAVDIGAVCFTLAVLQLIGIGFACHLSQQLKKSYYST